MLALRPPAAAAPRVHLCFSAVLARRRLGCKVPRGCLGFLFLSESGGFWEDIVALGRTGWNCLCTLLVGGGVRMMWKCC